MAVAGGKKPNLRLRINVTNQLCEGKERKAHVCGAVEGKTRKEHVTKHVCLPCWRISHLCKRWTVRRRLESAKKLIQAQV